MKNGVTYILCPNRKCKLFYSPSCYIPCEQGCPNKEKLKKIIKCSVCCSIIKLDWNQSTLQRVDCNCGVCHFRTSGKYHRIFKIEE